MLGNPHLYALITEGKVFTTTIRSFPLSGGLVIDTGDLYDSAITGGKLGVFVYDQPDVIWSNLKVGRL